MFLCVPHVLILLFRRLQGGLAAVIDVCNVVKSKKQTNNKQPVSSSKWHVPFPRKNAHLYYMKPCTGISLVGPDRLMMTFVSGWVFLVVLNLPYSRAFVGSSILPPLEDVAVGATKSGAFVSRQSPFASKLLSSTTWSVRQRRTRRCYGQASGRLGASMLLDFIKKRAQEGVEQTQNLVTAAQEGRLEEALKETSEYVKDRYAFETFYTLLSSFISSNGQLLRRR